MTTIDSQHPVKNRLPRLPETHPALLAEWSTRNTISASAVGRSSKNVVWWTCAVCMHHWRAAVYSRANLGSGCPFCNAGRLHSDGRNSLGVLRPELSNEWAARNASSPHDVTVGSSKRVWWTCARCEHQWYTAVSERTGSNPGGCPACSNRALHVDGRNSVAVKRPDLALEWHPDNSRKPEDVLNHSAYRAKWLCARCQNIWIATVNNRARTGCGFCAGRAVHSDGRNSLSTLYPAIAAEWHEDNSFLASEVTAYNSKKARWHCLTCSHVWIMAIVHRTKNGTSCHACTGRVLHGDGRNSLATLLPDLAFELSVDNVFLASEVTIKDRRRALWDCAKGHRSWEATVYQRAIDRTCCPSCLSSHGESQVADWLDANELQYRRQARFDSCRATRPLPFDFALDDLRILIEFQGEQHYRRVCFQTNTSMAESVRDHAERLERDSIKRRWSQCNGWLLVEIPYFDRALDQRLAVAIIARDSLAVTDTA